MPTLQPISLENIPDLAEQVADAFKKLSDDVIKRKYVKGFRTLTIVVAVKPDLKQAQDGYRNDPIIRSKVRVKTPDWESTEYRAFVRNRAGSALIMLNVDDPVGENPNQSTIFEMIPRPGEESAGA